MNPWRGQPAAFAQHVAVLELPQGARVVPLRFPPCVLRALARVGVVASSRGRCSRRPFLAFAPDGFSVEAGAAVLLLRSRSMPCPRRVVQTLIAPVKQRRDGNDKGPWCGEHSTG